MSEWIFHVYLNTIGALKLLKDLFLATQMGSISLENISMVNISSDNIHWNIRRWNIRHWNVRRWHFLYWNLRRWYVHHWNVHHWYVHRWSLYMALLYKTLELPCQDILEITQKLAVFSKCFEIDFQILESVLLLWFLHKPEICQSWSKSWNLHAKIWAIGSKSYRQNFQ